MLGGVKWTVAAGSRNTVYLLGVLPGGLGAYEAFRTVLQDKPEKSVQGLRADRRSDP